MASTEPTSLAVASLMCAEVYDLDVVDTEIQDGEGEHLLLFRLPILPWSDQPCERSANRTTFVAFRKAA